MNLFKIQIREEKKLDASCQSLKKKIDQLRSQVVQVEAKLTVKMEQSAPASLWSALQSLVNISRRHQNPDEIIDRQSKWTEMSFVRKQRLDEVDVDHEDTFDLN